MVPVEDDVRSQILGFDDRGADLGVVGVLRLQLDGDADGAGQVLLLPVEGSRNGTAISQMPKRVSSINPSTTARSASSLLAPMARAAS